MVVGTPCGRRSNVYVLFLYNQHYIYLPDLQQEHTVVSEYDEQTELETDKQLQQRAAAAVAEHEKAQAELQQAFSNATDHQVTQQELEQAFQNATGHHAVQTELQQAFQNAISNNPQTTVSALDDHDVNLKFKV